MTDLASAGTEIADLSIDDQVSALGIDDPDQSVTMVLENCREQCR
jgi:hypothetical protein